MCFVWQVITKAAVKVGKIINNPKGFQSMAQLRSFNSQTQYEGFQFSGVLPVLNTILRHCSFL